MQKKTLYLFSLIVVFALGFYVGGINSRSSSPQLASSSAAFPVTITSAPVSGGALPAARNDYIANKKTKIFHKPSCASVKQMYESNKKYYYSVTRQEVVDDGFAPCGRCHP